MYLISSNFQYKYHFVSNKEIAQAVVKDLSTRDACKNPDSIVLEECAIAFWDPGGALWTEDAKHIFKLKDIDIEIYNQHISSFADAVNIARLRVFDGVAYYKLYSHPLHCLCISQEELNQLKQQLSDEELISKSSEAQIERQSRLNDAGIITLPNTNNCEEKSIEAEYNNKTLH